MTTSAEVRERLIDALRLDLVEASARTAYFQVADDMEPSHTEAAHERNIEAGMLIADRQAAPALRSQFESLVERNLLRRIPGL